MESKLPTSPERPVVVYGATGYTGRMIVAELLRRGVPMVLAGRSRRDLDDFAHRQERAIPVRIASVDDPVSLRAMLVGASTLVNAAGPFSVTGRPVLEAVLDSGCHYVDTCADAFVMQTFFEEYDARARAARSTVLPGMSFYFVLADLLAHVLAEEQGELESVDIAYALEGWRFTPGSRAAFWDMVGRRLELVDGSLRVATTQAAPSSFAFLGDAGEGGATREQSVFAYPGGDVVTVPRHVATKNVTVSMTARTFVPRWATPALPALMAVLGSLSRSRLGPVLRRLSLRLPGRELDEQRAATGFTVEVHVRSRARVGDRAAAIRGWHMYGLGAWITADAAARLAAGEVVARGVLAPSQAFDPRKYLAAMRAGCELVRDVSIPHAAGS